MWGTVNSAIGSTAMSRHPSPAPTALPIPDPSTAGNRPAETPMNGRICAVKVNSVCLTPGWDPGLGLPTPSWELPSSCRRHCRGA